MKRETTKEENIPLMGQRRREREGESENQTTNTNEHTLIRIASR